ncbi:MAG: choice-of-anchor Q domain-containing protein [Opitutaceae bacterium]
MNANSRRRARRLILAAVTALAAHTVALGRDYYIAERGSGRADASCPADAAPPSWFNNPTNWGSHPGQISAGDTVHLRGTLTHSLVFRGGGQPGRPVVLRFDPGANLTAGVWPAATGAIDVDHETNIIIDGGASGIIGGNGGNPALVNGVIRNTENGTELAFREPSIFVRVVESSDVTVENLAFYNLYVRTSRMDEAPASQAKRDWSAVVFFDQFSPSRNMVVTNCIVHDAFSGLFMAYGPGCGNFECSRCTVYRCNWGGNCGDADGNARLDGLSVHDNIFRNFSNWEDLPVDHYHHDGFYGWAERGRLTRVRYYNNLVGPDFGSASAGLFCSGNISDVMIYNNVFRENPADHPADGLVYISPNAEVGGDFSVLNNTFLGGGSGVGVNFYRNRMNDSAVSQRLIVENNILCGLGTAIAVYNFGGLTVIVANHNLTHRLRPSMNYSISDTNVSHFLPRRRWQGLGYGLHGRSGDPHLGANCVPLSGSPAIGTGLDLSADFSTDWLGFPRPRGTAWDLGAAESVEARRQPGVFASDAKYR